MVSTPSFKIILGSYQVCTGCRSGRGYLIHNSFSSQTSPLVRPFLMFRLYDIGNESKEVGLVWMTVWGRPYGFY